MQALNSPQKHISEWALGTLGKVNKVAESLSRGFIASNFLTQESQVQQLSLKALSNSHIPIQLLLFSVWETLKAISSIVSRVNKVQGSMTRKLEAVKSWEAVVR